MFVAKAIRVLLPLAILSGLGWVAYWFYANKPEQHMVEMPPNFIRVEGVTLKATNHSVRVKSQGMVQARTRSVLLPEVTGKIVEVSPSFNEGGFFAKGELLLRLDPTDYETAIIQAKAEVAEAQAMLAEEEAKAAQAVANWKALGHSDSPPPLAARVPQLAQAKASALAAEARVMKAQRDLERTRILAPFAGQVLQQSADLGQLVSPGTALATVFATDSMEVRLPLPERDMGFLQLPESYQDGPTAEAKPVRVKLRSLIAGKAHFWEAKLVRVESAIDESTRQVMAVAQVEDPFSRKDDGRPPLRIGQFVDAEIDGCELPRIFVIPRSCVRAGNEVILISKENTLRRMSLEPLTGDERSLIVAADREKGPKPGDILCLTPIPFPADGAKVLPTIDGVAPAESSDLAGKKNAPKGTHAAR
jgi:membrane fusion protein, multidrug efflux system